MLGLKNLWSKKFTETFFNGNLFPSTLFLVHKLFGRVKFVTDSHEHQVYGTTRENLTFALRGCCLFLLYATVVIAATLAHVGLL